MIKSHTIRYLLKGVSFYSNLTGDELENFDPETILSPGYEFDNPYLAVLFIDFLLDISGSDISSLIDKLYITTGDLTKKLFSLTNSKSLEEIVGKWEEHIKGEL